MNYRQEAIKHFGSIYKDNQQNKYELIFYCPNCPKNKEPKLYVNTLNGIFHCFRCGYKGRLKGKIKISDIVSARNETNVKKENSIYLIPFNREELTSEQKQAIYNRGFTDEDIKYYNISGGKRIQIPNYVKGNLSDLICFWEWRKNKINKYCPKYLYSKDIKKSNVLFNLFRIKENSDITLCEGIFNAMTAGRNAVASYGCNLSDAQLKLLLDKKPKSITIAYDSDEAGQNGALDVIKKLKLSEYKGTVYYILLPKGTDINDMGKEKYQEYLKDNRIIIDLNSKISCNIPRLLFKIQ